MVQFLSEKPIGSVIFWVWVGNTLVTLVLRAIIVCKNRTDLEVCDSSASSIFLKYDDACTKLWHQTCYENVIHTLPPCNVSKIGALSNHAESIHMLFQTDIKYKVKHKNQSTLVDTPLSQKTLIIEFRESPFLDTCIHNNTTPLWLIWKCNAGNKYLYLICLSVIDVKTCSLQNKPY